MTVVRIHSCNSKVMIRADGKVVVDVAPPSFGGDVFTDNVLCTGLWTAQLNGKGTIVESGSKLTISETTVGWIGPQLINQQPNFGGDFSITIDWSAAAWPTPTGDFSYMGHLATFTSAWLNISNIKDSSGDRYYNAWTPGDERRSANNDNSGQLRVRRVGTTLYADFYSGGSWKNLHSITTATDLSYWDLSCGADHGPTPVTCDFDNCLVTPDA